MSSLQKAAAMALASWDGRTDRPIHQTMEDLRAQLAVERERAKKRQRKRRYRGPSPEPEK